MKTWNLLIIIFLVFPIWVYILARLVAKGTIRSILEELRRKKEERNGEKK